MTTTRTPPAPLWVGGQPAETADVRESINPATGEVVGTYCNAGPDDAQAAIDAAARAFRSTPWSRNPALRAAALEELAAALAARVPSPRSL